MLRRSDSTSSNLVYDKPYFTYPSPDTILFIMFDSLMRINMKTMIKKLFTISVLIFLTCSGLPAQAAKIKCWTNDQGVRECGTRVPAKYSQQGHEVLNKQGMVVDEKDRAKTEEEIEEEKRLAAIKLKEQEAREEQARRDKILLDIYTKVEDIEKARDENIKVIESRITLTRSRIEKTQIDLDKRIQAAAAEERSGNKPNEHMLKDIEVLQKRIKNNEQFIADREEEIQNVRNSYNADIERFKELTDID